MKKALLALALIATVASCQKEGSYEKPKNKNENPNNETKTEEGNQTIGTRLTKWIQGVDYLTHNAQRPDSIFTLKYDKDGRIKQIIRIRDSENDNDIYNISYEDGYLSTLATAGWAPEEYMFDENGRFIKKDDMSGAYILEYNTDGMLLSNKKYFNGSLFNTVNFHSENSNLISTSNGYTFTYTDKVNVLKDILLLNCFTNRFGLVDFFGIPEIFASKNLPNSYKRNEGETKCSITYTYNAKGLLAKAVADGESAGRGKYKLTLSFFYE